MVDPINIILDAAAFYKVVREDLQLEWDPHVRISEEEILFEWIDGVTHAIVSIDGEGTYGYAMLSDEGTFCPGAVNNPPVNTMPDDLRIYIEENT